MATKKDDVRIAPNLRGVLYLQDKANAGDMLWVCSPATVVVTPTAAAWTREVTVSLQTAAGEVHTWFNKAITTGVSIADTSTAGTATIPATTLTVVNGVAVVTVSGDAADWLNAETDTLTVAEAVVMGTTCAAKTSVQTFTT